MPTLSDVAHASPCPISRACGGCALIDRRYDDQLRQKTDRVLTAIRAESELADVTVSDCLAAPATFAYRNRAKLAVARVGDETRIGLYRRGSNAVVDLAPCLVTSSTLRRGVDALRPWLTTHRLAPPDGAVFYVDLRESVGGRWHLTLVVDGERFDPATLPLDALAHACPELVGVALNHGNASSSYPMGTVTQILRGGESFEAALPDESGGDVVLTVPVGGFFQVATSLLPAVHARMRAHLEGEGPLYDLYCGVGLHGLMVERDRARDAQIVGIEESAAAVRAAQANARRLGVAARYVAGHVEELLAAELDERGARRFVLNPARAGCRPAVLESIAVTEGARIAYLSCNAETLARDLAIMARAGLRPTEILPLDFMPQTDQVETLALVA